MRFKYLPRAARALAALILLGLSPVLRSENEPPTKFTISRIKPDLYVLHNDFVPGNVTALVTAEGILLVDDKFPVDHDNLVSALRTVCSKPVRFVVNTHYHWDHCGGNVKLQESGAQVVAAQGVLDKMLSINRPGLPNIVFDRAIDLYLGGKRIEVRHFGRGHTNGDSVVYFPDDHALATGDLFTFGQATPELIDYSAGGSAREWSTTLDAALQLDFDTVIPGHGNVTNKQELRNFRDSTVALRTRVHEVIVQNKGREEVAKMLEQEFHWTSIQLDRGLDGLMGELR